MASISPQTLLVVVVGMLMLCGRHTSARFFLLGDVEDAQPENRALAVNVTALHEFTLLGHDVDSLAMTTNSVRGQINYVLGSRVNGTLDFKIKPTNQQTDQPKHNTHSGQTLFLGDVLVAHGAKNQPLPSVQDVALTITYPASGLGAQVTYVAIQVDQVTRSVPDRISLGE